MTMVGSAILACAILLGAGAVAVVGLVFSSFIALRTPSIGAVILGLAGVLALGLWLHATGF
jgi:hypothetical protein